MDALPSYRFHKSRPRLVALAPPGRVAAPTGGRWPRVWTPKGLPQIRRPLRSSSVWDPMQSIESSTNRTLSQPGQLGAIEQSSNRIEASNREMEASKVSYGIIYQSNTKPARPASSNRAIELSNRSSSTRAIEASKVSYGASSRAPSGSTGRQTT